MKTIALPLSLIFCLSAAIPLLAGGTDILSNETARASYAIGMNLGHVWKQNDIDVDDNMLVRGIKDAESGGAMLLTPQEMHDTLMELQRNVMAKREKEQAATAEKNKQEGEAFLEKNKTKPGVVSLPDGLEYKIIKKGEGESPSSSDIVTVNYSGKLLDGTEFDSSYKRGKPAEFPVTGVIHGWTEALQKMKIGSKWELFIPSNLAYGPSGRSGIPPNAVLIFDVELLSISHSNPPRAMPPAQPLTSDIIKVPSAAEMKKGAKIETIKPEDVEKMRQSETN
jgi:FKBP-type peptidyl-prolyl cis-trans isomerase FklB